MIFITGASRGIGKYLFDAFKAEEYIVEGTYNGSVPESTNSANLTKVNVTNLDEVNNWLLPKLSNSNENILINCAGINYASLAHLADIDKWKEVINVNLFGTFNTIHTVLPAMRENGFGRIINFSSVVSQKGIQGTSAYAASKSALSGLVKSIAAENASKGITINNINLGYFDIGMISEVPEKFHPDILKSIPSKKFGRPEDILKTIKYLIATEYVNGTSIDLSSGMV